MSPAAKRLLAVVLPVQMVLATFALIDLARRPASAVRGPKWLWRVLIPMNVGNSVLYWLFGRRPVAGRPADR